MPALALLAIAAGILFATLGAGEDGSGAAAGKNDSPDVSDDVARLKLPQRVDQLVIAGFDDVASEEFELRRGPTGGVLIGSQNWSNAKEGGELIKRLRSAAGSSPAAQPLFVAQQEGGAYRTLGDLPPAEAELQIGEGGSTRAARDWSLKAGRALREVGFDLNLFPIADVATLDSVVADRSFGDDAELDAAMTEAAIEGCADAGILCAPGRFPGMGAASADTADGPASVSLDAGSLESRDLLPFRAAFRAGAPAVVLSLALYAAYDPVTAAALSPAIATDLLRNQLGYEGAAITDDLSSGAVTAAQGAPEAAVAAIAAGADMVVVGAPRRRPPRSRGAASGCPRGRHTRRSPRRGRVAGAGPETPAGRLAHRAGPADNGPPDGVPHTTPLARRGLGPLLGFQLLQAVTPLRLSLPGLHPDPG